MNNYFLLIIIFLLTVHLTVSARLRAQNYKSLEQLGKSSEDEIDTNQEASPEELDLVAVVNKYRQELGLSTLRYNELLSKQAQSVVEHIIQTPQEFNKNYDFDRRSQEISNRYYTEDQCKLLFRKSAAEKCLQLMIIDPDAQADLERDHDEAGSFCGLYGNGYICSIQMIKLKQEETLEDLTVYM